MPSLDIRPDENVAPNGKIITFNKKLINGNNNIQEKKVAARGRPLGRRSALGDVTNKTIITTIHSEKIANLKKPSENKLQKAVKSITIETIKIDHNSKENINININKSKDDKPEEYDEISSAIISSNLEIMSINHKLTPHNIDYEDRFNELSCWQYAEDIHKYYHELERHRVANANYITKHKDVNEKMRAVLIDWLVDVHFKYQLLPQTIYIAINIMDRYLDKDCSIVRQNLQLAGIAAMFIASKYEEIYPPEALDFVRITDNAYTVEQLFQMEQQTLAAIGYRLTFPTCYQFLQRYFKATKTMDKKTRYFAQYITDRTLQEYKLLKYLPSQIAASSLILARKQMNELPIWSDTAVYHSGYSEFSLLKCIEDIKEMLWLSTNGAKSTKLTAVRRKYSKERFLSVATLTLNVFTPTK